MEKFACIAEEYIFYINIEFKKDDSDDDNSRFTAIITWGEPARSRSFDIAFDYEATWDCYGDRLHEWQFLFSGGEATRELSTEVFFLDLFFYLDELIDATKPT
ncbi:MAG: hypothetical protein ACR2MX_01690 [Cyclobacteriaceae bacterium]